MTTESKMQMTAGPSAMRTAFKSLVNRVIRSPVLWLL